MSTDDIRQGGFLFSHFVPRMQSPTTCRLRATSFGQSHVRCQEWDRLDNDAAAPSILSVDAFSGARVDLE